MSNLALNFETLEPLILRILLIDNFDSFTHNLARYFVELDHKVDVKRNDELSLQDIKVLAPDLICISPGPCTPNQAGISLDVVAQLKGKLPILGVCLGHQTIAQHFGASVTKAFAPMHGKVSAIRHSGHKMFHEIPEIFEVTRYHSLVVANEDLPSDIEVTAWCENQLGDREIMAIAHRHLPLWGVQFHPESHLTQFGHRLLKNVINLLI